MKNRIAYVILMDSTPVGGFTGMNVKKKVEKMQAFIFSGIFIFF